MAPVVGGEGQVRRPAEDVGPYLALPLGELSAQPTERACMGMAYLSARR